MRRVVVLALALILALSEVAAAAPKTTHGLRIDTTCRLLEGGAIDPEGRVPGQFDYLPPGSTVCFLLLYETFTEGELVSSLAMTRPEQVEGMAVNQTWISGPETSSTDKLIESVSIEKQRSGSSAFYYLTVKISDDDPTYLGGVTGRISVTKPAPAGEEEDRLRATIDIRLQIGHKFATSISRIEADTLLLYNFGRTGFGAMHLTGEQVLMFGSGAYFVIDITEEADWLAIGYHVAPRPAVAAAYPRAKLRFLNFSGTAFIRNGVLSIPAQEGSLLYAVQTDGGLTALQAPFDAREGAFKLKTRVLGQYVISDSALTPGAAAAAPAKSSAAPKPAGSSAAVPSQLAGGAAR